MNKTKAPRGKRTPRSVVSQQQERGFDLSSLFGAATQALAANQSSLNQADTENQNHGDNMVQVFNMITQAMASKPNASPSQQLSQASQYLAQNATNGSAYVYSQGLAQAAQEFQGQPALTPNNAGMLIQALLSGGQQPAAQSSGGGLLGASMGQGQSASQASAGDLLGALMGQGQAANQSGGQDSGIDLGDVVNAGMAFMNAKQQGQGNLQAGLAALMAVGPMAGKPHREQSGQLVANALLQAISGMSGNR
jgi:hypothetical protein